MNTTQTASLKTSPMCRADARAAQAFEASRPDGVPKGHRGPFVLASSGRSIWWTGRVAIGIRHRVEPEPPVQD